MTQINHKVNLILNSCLLGVCAFLFMVGRFPLSTFQVRKQNLPSDVPWIISNHYRFRRSVLAAKNAFFSKTVPTYERGVSVSKLLRFRCNNWKRRPVRYKVVHGRYRLNTNTLNGTFFVGINLQLSQLIRIFPNLFSSNFGIYRLCGAYLSENYCGDVCIWPRDCHSLLWDRFKEKMVLLDYWKKHMKANTGK